LALASSSAIHPTRWRRIVKRNPLNVHRGNHRFMIHAFHSQGCAITSETPKKLLDTIGTGKNIRPASSGSPPG
ncbi:MAG: hypothetical protein KGR68_17970, partial [Betaproteobacteria bacterium]|nr:hypothetical protein [Betaproteobacteria bacterium]